MAVRKALIADDHSLYRQGLKRLLMEELDFDEVFEASNLPGAIAILDAEPGIELMLADLHMPGVQGVSSYGDVKRRFPKGRIALVTASQVKDDIMAAVSLGLSGFIPKSLPNPDVILAIETICKGHIFVPSLWLDGRYSSPASETSCDLDARSMSRVQLTHRQRDVLECLKRAMTNRQIAEELKISVGTVKIHVASILNLLGVDNRIQIAVAAPNRSGSQARM